MKAPIENGWLLTGSHPGFWEFGRSMELGIELKGLIPWIPAKVPGSVHYDLYESGYLPDPYWGLNSQACEWVNDRNWLYRNAFVADERWRGRKVRLVCEGIDYSAKLRLNGQPLGEHRGMFTPAEFDLTDRLRWGESNELLIGIDVTPEGVPQLGYTNRVNHLKSRFGYKWDFCPRLQNMGLWKPVYLRINGSSRFNDVHWKTSLHEDGAQGHVTVVLDNEKGGQGSVITSLFAPDGTLCSSRTTQVQLRPGLQSIEQRLEIAHPELWYPNGYGNQPLYRLVAEVRLDGQPYAEPSDERELTVGIRTLAFTQNPGAPDDSLAYTVIVNDRPVYLKGWNWVPVDQLYGRERREQYEHLIRLAKEANVNLLRVWGGGLIERELFYELCDQAGILIWQEMMQSSSGFNNEPSADAAFLHELQQTMRCVIREKRNHPSLAIWCGGNELTEGGHLQDRLVPLTDSHPNLRMLRDLVADLDGERLFLPSSSSGPVFFLEQQHAGQGLSYDVHGPWKYAGDVDHYTLYNGSDALLHSEYGADGFASMESLKRFLPADELTTMSVPSPTWLHHGYEYWNMDEQLERLFGPGCTLEEKVRLSQWLQAESIGYAVESNRRRAPRCSGSILWQMNEPFPNVSCTSAVDYYGLPKPAYFRTALAQRPLYPSAQFDKLAYARGEAFQARLFICADHPDDAETQLSWAISNQAGETLLKGETESFQMKELVTACGSINWTIPDDCQEVFRLDLKLQTAGNGEIENHYLFACKSDDPASAPLQTLRSFL